MTLLGLPIYNCHKKVGAARIEGISPVETGGAVLALDTNPGTLQIQVDAAWLTRNPALAVRGYLVQYIQNEDLYTAYSPKDAFENGYSLDEPGYEVDGIIDVNQSLIDAKLLLSRIETTAVNEPHMVKSLVDEANSNLDELFAFLNPGSEPVILANSTPASVEPASPPAPGPVPGTPYPAGEAQATEQAADTQEQENVGQPQEATTGGEAQAPE